MHGWYPGYPVAEMASRGGLVIYTRSGSQSLVHVAKVKSGVVVVVIAAGLPVYVVGVERSKRCTVERLEVGRCVRTAAGVVVLLEIRLEGRGARVGWLVAESGTGAGHEVVVVLGDAALALLHAPEDESNAAEEEGTADTTDNTADNLLVALAQTATVAAAAALGLRGVGDGCLASGSEEGAGAGAGDLRGLAVDDGAVNGGVELNRGRDEGRGADEGCGPERRRGCSCCAC